MESKFSTHQDKVAQQDSQAPANNFNLRDTIPPATLVSKAIDTMASAAELPLSLMNTRPPQAIAHPSLQTTTASVQTNIANKLLNKLLQEVNEPSLQQRLQVAVQQQPLDDMVERLQGLATKLDAEANGIPNKLAKKWQQTYSRINKTRRLLAQTLYPSDMYTSAQYTFAQDIMPSYLRRLTEQLQQTQKMQLQLVEETTKLVADTATRCLIFQLTNQTTRSTGYLSICLPEEQVNSCSLNILAEDLYRGDLAKVTNLHYRQHETADIFIGFSTDNQEFTSINELMPTSSNSAADVNTQFATLLAIADTTSKTPDNSVVRTDTAYACTSLNPK